ncbi:ACP phosphodiesterase [Dokdonella sp.]|uniref:acyl carrier protein phosphodiesterase n=1 Tax=Dokdonella sp. TaxID=2291710 RepID=UPI003C5FFCF3
MNHLAHALLSGPDPDLRLGGMLGDFVRGRIDPGLQPGVRSGIALHRAIDRYTDDHAEVRALRQMYEPPYRRYAGILIDIWFDHLLAHEFDQWSDVPLAIFSDDLLVLLESRTAELPESLQRFTRYLHARRLPAAYARRDMISEVLVGVGARLKRANPLANGLLEISRLEVEHEQAFARFFPQLVEFARQWRTSDAQVPA